MTKRLPRPDPWLALAARVEAATEEDRALDFLINEAAGTAWREVRNEPGFVGEYVRGYNPHVTSSVEAAVALFERVLPGWHWTVARHFNMPDGDSPDPRPYYADAASPAWILGETDRTEHAEAFGETPALAVCKALIRAMTPQNEPVDGSSQLHKGERR